MLTFVSPSEEIELKEYFSNRFGISREAFKDLRLLRSGRTIWVVVQVPGLEDALHSLKIEAAGVPFLRIRDSRVKPTTRALQLFGRWASRNIIDLDDESMDALFNEGTVSRTYPVEPGFVILRWKGSVLGCGYYAQGNLRSQIPLALWRNMKGKAEAARPASSLCLGE